MPLHSYEMAFTSKKVYQHLGSFLKNQNTSNNEIYFKTGIDPTRISKLSRPEKDTISALEFYLIALAIGADLDEMANHVFSDYRLKETPISSAAHTHKLTELGKFLNEGLILQKTVAHRTNIKESKLSSLSNDKNIEPMAKDLYLIALALNKKPSDAFNFVNKDVVLNSSNEEEQLREKYKKLLLNAKTKRDGI